jgi:uncharacterized protein
VKKSAAGAQAKLDHLLQLLADGPNLAVACSGGVDSTFLLYAAVKALPPDRVVAWHCRSSLGSARALAGCRHIFALEVFAQVRRGELIVDPLAWPGVAENNENRCYHCKKGMYQALRNTLKDGFALADGTNLDDLQQHRPGLRALRELKVLTPLVAAGLTKEDIRLLARDAGLPNHHWPANSCLATRTAQGSLITPDILRRIEKAEEFVTAQGFIGCRVRLSGSVAVVELAVADISRFAEELNRNKILTYFQSLNLDVVHLNLLGR